MNLRLKHFCFLVAGTSHGRQCDLKNYFPSFVVTPGMGKFTRMCIVEGKRETEIVFCLGEKEKKKPAAVVSRYLLT